MMKKFPPIFKKTASITVFMVFVLSILIGSFAYAGNYPTVADPKGIKTTYPQQLDLDEYEKADRQKTDIQ